MFERRVHPGRRVSDSEDHTLGGYYSALLLVWVLTTLIEVFPQKGENPKVKLELRPLVKS